MSATQLLPLKLYPTITNGELTVDNTEYSVLGTQYPIEIYSLSGALVAIYKTAGKQTTLNLSQLPSSTYIVRVGRYVGKVVKR